MKHERPAQRTHQVTRKETRQYWKEAYTYEAGAWRDDETSLRRESHLSEAYLPSQLTQFDAVNPDARERSRLLRLLGLINYRILTGNRVYVEVGGIVYKTLYGGYWRSVFTGVEHYLLKCQAVSGGVWTEGSNAVDLVDLPIAHTQEGWTAQGHSVMFMLNRDQ
jgi:hypothetical protein